MWGAREARNRPSTVVLAWTCEVEHSTARPDEVSHHRNPCPDPTSQAGPHPKGEVGGRARASGSYSTTPHFCDSDAAMTSPGAPQKMADTDHCHALPSCPSLLI